MQGKSKRRDWKQNVTDSNEQSIGQKLVFKNKFSSALSCNLRLKRSRKYNYKQSLDGINDRKWIELLLDLGPRKISRVFASPIQHKKMLLQSMSMLLSGQMFVLMLHIQDFRSHCYQ